MFIAVQLFYSFYQIQNCLITSAGRHTRAPATVYPVCGVLIVVLNRKQNGSVCSAIAIGGGRSVKSLDKQPSMVVLTASWWMLLMANV